MFDRLLGFDCITSKKASHEAPEQTHKHNVQLIQLIVELRTPATPVGVGGGKERGGCHLNLRT